MERTYNIFVDNGMFVAMNYLGIDDISDLKIEDITKDETLHDIAKDIAESLEMDEYRRMAFSTFLNSAYTQQLKKGNTRFDTIKGSFKTLVDSVGDDLTCLICGEKKVNVQLEISRAYMHGLTSKTFMNSASNLKGINVCSHCLLLSLFSFINVRKIKEKISFCIFNSDDNYFMQEYTEESIMQRKNKVYCENENVLLFDEAYKKIDYIDEGCFITQLNFVNTQSVDEEEKELDNNKIRFLKAIKRENVADELAKNGLKIFILKNYDMYNYIANKELDVSLKLLKITMREIDNMSDNSIKLIEKVTTNLFEALGYDDLRKGIKKAGNRLDKIEEQLINWQDEGVDIFDDLTELETIKRNFTKVDAVSTTLNKNKEEK